MEESSFYQFILDEGRAEGFADGFKEALEEGREEGRREERRRLLKITAGNLRRLIKKRFPDLQVGEDLEAIGYPNLPLRLFVEFEDIREPEFLQRRITELASISSSSSPS